MTPRRRGAAPASSPSRPSRDRGDRGGHIGDAEEALTVYCESPSLEPLEILAYAQAKALLAIAEGLQELLVEFKEGTLNTYEMRP